MVEKNFTLLTQAEIDTLVDFLQEKKDSLGDEVLTQESIDKIIRMVKTRHTRHFAQNNKFWAAESEQYLISIGFRKNMEELCELKLRKKEDDFVELYIVNHASGKEMVLLPEDFSDPTAKKTVSEGWGYSIIPAFFDQIAEVFALRYTKETYDKVCEIFAEKNFGKKELEIPAAFVCDGTFAIDRLL